MIWSKPFPRTFEELLRYGVPYYGGFAKELAWAIGALRPHSEELNDFIQLKALHERSILTGPAVETDKILADVEEKFGTSLWLLENQFNALQEKDDTRAIRTKTRQIVQNEKASGLVRWLTSWIGYKAEPSVSRSEMDRLLGEGADGRTDLSFMLRALMGASPNATPDALGMMIAYTDTLPLIDRYQIITIALQLFIARGTDTNTDLAIATVCLDHLRTFVTDPLLDILCFAYNLPCDNSAGDLEFIAALDMYSAGEYTSVISTIDANKRLAPTLECLTLAIRSDLAMHGECSSAEQSEHGSALFREVRADLNSIISFSADASIAYTRLQKRLLTYCNTRWANSLALVLAHQRNDERVLPATQDQKLHALRSEALHPSFGFLLPTDQSRGAYFQSLLAHSGMSPTARSLASIFLGSLLQDTSIAPERLNRIHAMTHARHGNFSSSAAIFEDVLSSDSSKLFRDEAALILMHIYIKQKRFADGSDLAVRLAMQCPYTAEIVSLTDLVHGLLTEHDLPMSRSPTRGLVSVAIVYDLYSKLFGSAHDPQRADAYKDVLRRANVTRASELSDKRDLFDYDQLCHFLRHVCRPNVLDQSLTLSSTREVEDERAAVLVGLSDFIAEHGGSPPAELKEELREIRTKQVVRETTLRLDQSKIYVNLDGIRRSLETATRDNWHRYRILSLQGASADLRSIERILRSTGSESFRVIVLDQERHEKSAVLAKMVTDAVELFAFSKEFGLDSNLSTNIRHGYVLRELRSPFVVARLITNKSSASGNYQPNLQWTDRLGSEDDSEALSAILDRFSRDIDLLIDRVNRQLLRIRSSQSPDGLFVYQVDDRLVEAVGLFVGQVENHDEFITELIDICWRLTDSNLSRVRDVLVNEVLHEFFRILSVLQNDLNDSGYASKIPGMMNAINLVRPEVRSAVERVQNWFTRSSIDEYQDFDLQIAYDAGLQTIKTYYSNIDIVSNIIIKAPLHLSGSTLPIFARLLFLLLDNAAQHGGADRDNLRIDSNFEVSDGLLYVEIANDLPKTLDRQKLLNKIYAINQEYGREKASDLLRQEGGSGYPKVWKLIHFDLRKAHELDVSLQDDRYVIRLIMDVRGIIR